MSTLRHAIRSSLEIDESINLHRTGWIVQRIGWVIIIGIMAAGLMGLFGEGPISRAHPLTGGIETTYERFFRFESEMKIVIRSSGEHISNITFSQHYLKNFKILRFIPEPENNTTTTDKIIYNFLPGQNELVSIYITPTSYGTIKGTMHVNDVNTFTLHHFIFP